MSKRDMKQKRDKSKSAEASAPKQKSMRDVAVLAGFFALPVILIVWLAQRPAPVQSGNLNSPAAPTSSSTNQNRGSEKQVTQPPPTSQGSSVAPKEGTAAAAPASPTGDPSQLVASLAEIDFSGSSLNADQVAQWRVSFQRLVQHGAGAVPAIREFLNRNVDVDFDAAKGGNLLGYATLRLALIDALRQISGPQSIATSVQVLQATADPAEIAVLARNLEQQAPGLHRKEAVGITREVLGQAERGQLEGHDVGPLFEVLQQYGGASVTPDLERVASKWNFYSTIALGGLPDGAGVPSLKRLAQDVSIQNVMAYRILAQLAGKYPEARAFLLSQIRSNAMPYSAWSGVQAALGGEVVEYGAPVMIAGATPASGQNVRSYHINYGNQNYRTVPTSADWPETQLKDQISLIDQVIAVDANMETLQFLQDARIELASKLKK